MAGSDIDYLGDTIGSHPGLRHNSSKTCTQERRTVPVWLEFNTCS